MLVELTISNFAIIEHVSLQFRSGMTVLSGETGAGKSIIIDALGILRGDKFDVSFIRTNCDRHASRAYFTFNEILRSNNSSMNTVCVTRTKNKSSFSVKYHGKVDVPVPGLMDGL